MAKKNYIMRRFSLSDVEKSIQLLTTVFGTQFTTEWWKWKYQQNPAGFYGEQGDIWVAESSNEIVGYYAVLPVKMSYYSKITIAAQSVDTATHPNYRGLGIFSNLARNVYSESRKRYSFLYGFPTEMAYKGFLKLGWKDMRINTYIKILNYEHFLSNFLSNYITVQSAKTLLKLFSSIRSISINNVLKRHKGDAVVIKKINRFPSEVDSFWNSIKLNFKISIERQSNFLNWRFSNLFGDYHPYIAVSNKGEILGYMVLKAGKIKNTNSINIIDIQVLPEQEKCFNFLLNEAIRFSEEKKADLIYLWYPKRLKYSYMLTEHGFISLDRLPKKMGYISNRVIFYLFDKEFLFPELEKDWFYTLLDHDFA